MLTNADKVPNARKEDSGSATMHELGIAKNIVSIAGDFAQGRPVLRVRLELGELSAVAPDAIRFCFEVCAKGTLVEGAELTIDQIAPKGLCLDCNSELVLASSDWSCNCGSKRIKCIAGLELRVKELEVA